jgi:hypothetical protein
VAIAALKHILHRYSLLYVYMMSQGYEVQQSLINSGYPKPN